MGKRLEEAQVLEFEDVQSLPKSASTKKKKNGAKLEEHVVVTDTQEKKKKKKNKAEAEELTNGSEEKSKKKNKHKRDRESESVTDVLETENLSGKNKKNKTSLEEKTKEITGEEERRSDGTIVISGKNITDAKYASLKSFAESGLPDNVLECCKTFDRPSPIQSQAWPFLLNGRDFIGIAKTGSGKTLAFGVPAIIHILNKRKNKTFKKINPLCLVLSPTRELAQQIYDVMCDAGQHCGVKSVCIYGGTSKGPQISSLKSGVDIVIGTPGRLRDLIEMGVCCLNEVNFIHARWLCLVLRGLK